MDLSAPNTFYAKDLHIQTRTNLKKIPVPSASDPITFGKYSSDYMMMVDSKDHVWGKPIIVPQQKILLSPNNTSLHYGIQCFEGLKAYKTNKGELRLFRPDCNMRRFKNSSVRLALPDFDGEQLIKCIQRLIKLEQRWFYNIPEYSLYLRPLHISMEEQLGVKAANHSRLMVLASPAGPYYAKGVKPIKLATSPDVIRSCHKGTGCYKVGGNYASTLLASLKAKEKGYDQILWLYGDDGNEQVIQIGASNIFFVCKTETDGVKQILTPDIEDLILPGVTRDSIIELMSNKPGYKVTVRKVFMKEIIQKIEKKQLLECFGAGTAVIVSPVEGLQYQGKYYSIQGSQKQSVTQQIKSQLLGIQEGRIADKFGWIRTIK